jgi:peptidoglycan/xylan/chitin deacetylase (PgdA/CDA1 family)
MHEQEQQRLVVLMYHGLHRGAADPGRFDSRYSVRPEDFFQQLLRLRQISGDSWLPAREAALTLPRSDGKRPSVMITFDDGDVSNALQALPRLQALGLGATFFVTSEFVGSGGMVTPAQLRTLANAGMLIGSHGASHRFLSTLSTPELYSELQRSRDVLENIIARPVDLLALPGGRGGPRELDAARSTGYRAVFGSQPGDNHDWEPGEFVQRVPITRDLSLPAFEQILRWGGTAARRLRWRHNLLAMPKRLLGDERYDRLRQSLVG